MASRYLDFIGQKGTYAIGNLNSQWAKPLANGVIAGEKLENFVLVETAINEEGKRVAKYLTDATKKEGVFLLTAVERRVEEVGETLSDFYVGEGEPARVHILESGLRFETSKIEKDTALSGVVKVGCHAYFDPSTKSYKVIPASAVTSDLVYPTAGLKFLVVDVDTELGYAEERETIRLELI